MSACATVNLEVIREGHKAEYFIDTEVTRSLVAIGGRDAFQVEGSDPLVWLRLYRGGRTWFWKGFMPPDRDPSGVFTRRNRKGAPSARGAWVRPRCRRLRP